MRVEEVIMDASPLIVLFRSHQIYILPQLFNTIWVPNAVWEEVTNEKYHDVAFDGLINAQWIQRVNVEQIPNRIKKRELGKGESEVLSFALNSPNVYAVLDDLAARRCAKALKIPILGTGGLFILAKQRGIISSVTEALLSLRAVGLWLSEDVLELLITKAGESK